MKIAELRSIVKDFPSALRPSLIKRLTGDAKSGQANRVLKSVSLELHSGDFALLRGRNGSGKTTLLRILAGILTPTAGERIVAAPVAALLSPHAYFFNELPLSLSLEFTAACFGIERSRLRVLSKEVLPAFAPLTDESKAFFLTPGQRTRLILELACRSPVRLIVIDEALSLLDPETRAGVAKNLSDFCVRGGAVLAVTHGVEIHGVTRELELNAGLVG